MPMYYRPPEDRPLRFEQVRRDELLVDPRYVCLIRTMPLGTWRRVERKQESEDEDPIPYAVAGADLWRPVLDELAAAAEQQRRDLEATAREHPEFASLVRTPEAPTLPEFFLGENVLEFACHECGEWALGIIWRRRVHVCSDSCSEAHRKRVYQDWRDFNPRDPETVNATRAKRRAEARAGRKCEHCGKPIDAARATKRFCSDIYRGRGAPRDTRREAREDGRRSNAKNVSTSSPPRSRPAKLSKNKACGSWGRPRKRTIRSKNLSQESFKTMQLDFSDDAMPLWAQLLMAGITAVGVIAVGKAIVTGLASRRPPPHSVPPSNVSPEARKSSAPARLTPANGPPRGQRDATLHRATSYARQYGCGAGATGCLVPRLPAQARARPRRAGGSLRRRSAGAHVGQAPCLLAMRQHAGRFRARRCAAINGMPRPQERLAKLRQVPRGAGAIKQRRERLARTGRPEPRRPFRATGRC